MVGSDEEKGASPADLDEVKVHKQKHDALYSRKLKMLVISHVNRKIFCYTVSIPVACIFPFPHKAQHALWSFVQLGAPEKIGDKQALNLVNMTAMMMFAVFVIKLSSKFLVSYLKNDIAMVSNSKQAFI